MAFTGWTLLSNRQKHPWLCLAEQPPCDCSWKDLTFEFPHTFPLKAFARLQPFRRRSREASQCNESVALICSKHSLWGQWFYSAFFPDYCSTLSDQFAFSLITFFVFRFCYFWLFQSFNLKTFSDSMMTLEMWISSSGNQAEISLCEKTLIYHCFNPKWLDLEFIEENTQENNLVLSRTGNQAALGKCCQIRDRGVTVQSIFHKMSDPGELLLHLLWKAPGDKDYLETWDLEIIQSSIQFKNPTTQRMSPVQTNECHYLC